MKEELQRHKEELQRHKEEDKIKAVIELLRPYFTLQWHDDGSVACVNKHGDILHFTKEDIDKQLNSFYKEN